MTHSTNTRAFDRRYGRGFWSRARKFSAPDKCPHCGSKSTVECTTWRRYACESVIHADGQNYRDPLSLERAARAATKRELESAKDLHQQCLNSVTMICVTFPNAAEYVRQLEKQRDSAEARVAELEAAIELARVGH